MSWRTEYQTKDRRRRDAGITWTTDYVLSQPCLKHITPVALESYLLSTDDGFLVRTDARGWATLKNVLDSRQRHRGWGWPEEIVEPWDGKKHAEDWTYHTKDGVTQRRFHVISKAFDVHEVMAVIAWRYGISCYNCGRFIGRKIKIADLRVTRKKDAYGPQYLQAVCATCPGTKAKKRRDI